jgi:hypothetical protein
MGCAKDLAQDCGLGRSRRHMPFLLPSAPVVSSLWLARRISILLVMAKRICDFQFANLNPLNPLIAVTWVRRQAPYDQASGMAKRASYPLGHQNIFFASILRQ